MLVWLLDNDNLDINIRLSAAIEFKNHIKTNWRQVSIYFLHFIFITTTLRVSSRVDKIGLSMLRIFLTMGLKLVVLKLVL